MATQPVQLVLALEFPEPKRIDGPGPRSRFTELAGYLRQHPGEGHQVALRPSIRSAQLFATDLRRGRPRVFAGMEARVMRGFEVWARAPLVH